MRNNLENSSAMLESADTLVSADYALRNHASLSLEQLNDRAKQEKNKRKSREKTEYKEHQKADVDLENELSFLGVSTSNEKQEDIKIDTTETNQELSTADQVKTYTESIRQGRSQTEILQLLISKFEGNEAVSKWVKNWKNYLRLHKFAETRNPREKTAIKSIISKASFSDENAFNISLQEISQSTEISDKTKFEVMKQFGGSHIDSVDGMDFQLKEMKSYAKAIKQELKVKSSKRETLDDDIEALENELNSLPLDSPKRQEIEEKIEQKKDEIKETETTINDLKEAQPNNISFQLRQGFFAKLNSDGSRSISLDGDSFSLKLPSHNLPFTTTRNLRTINLSFPYKAMKNLHIADTVFGTLNNNSLPSKSQRDLSHLVLSSLGFDDTKILSEESIKQLNKDLSSLNPQVGRTGEENLIEFGIFNANSRSLNKGRLKEVLMTIRENRGVQKDVILERIN